MCGRLHDEPMQLPRSRRLAAVLAGEPLTGEFGTQPVADLLGDGRAVVALPGRQPAGEFGLERRRLGPVHRVPTAQLLAGHRVEAGTEQQLHLLARDLVSRNEADAGQAAAVPVLSL